MQDDSCTLRPSATSSIFQLTTVLRPDDVFGADHWPLTTDHPIANELPPVCALHLTCRKIISTFPNHLASGSPGSSGSGKFNKKWFFNPSNCVLGLISPGACQQQALTSPTPAMFDLFPDSFLRCSKSC